MSSKRDPSRQRPRQAQVARLRRLLGAVTFTLSLLSPTTNSEARCLISAEEGAALPQGEVIADLGGIGGSQGGGYSLGARLGLNEQRELQLRAGGCQRAPRDSLENRERVSLWGNGLTLGLKQGLLTAEETSSVELSISIKADVLNAVEDQERGEAFTSLGFTPALLLSYPFAITADREGFVTLTLGGGAQFVDQNRQASRFELTPIIGLSGGAEVLPLLSLRGILNWQDNGVYGGASIAYRF